MFVNGDIMKRILDYIKNHLLPCLGFSVLTGILAAIIITAFKIAVTEVIELSEYAYHAVRENPVWIPVLIIGAAALGLISSLLLTLSRSCRGGGIPTSVAAIRGVVSFKWQRCIPILPISSLVTYLCGVPLGTEGPCVQLGTAIGDGVVGCLGKKHKGWRRYIMTGGASAGFSIATASPITAIIFSMEELHKHFSPLLLTVASVTVLSAQTTVQILAELGIGSAAGFFHFETIPAAIAAKEYFAPVLIGLACGIASILFTKCYHIVDGFIRKLLKKLPIKVVYPILFALTAVVGFFFAESLGTGHHLTDGILFNGRTAWYLLLLIFLVRMLGMMVTNTAGVTGGVFLPTISFGALIGALMAEAMIGLGWLSEDSYVLMVVLGIAAFLGATSRIPLTAAVFAVEALGGIYNILPIVIAVAISLIVAEASGIEDFTDTVIESKMNSVHSGCKPMVVTVPLTVKEGSFAVGKETRDTLLPHSCVLVSYEAAGHHHGHAFMAGDVLTVRYETYNPRATRDELIAIVGEQSNEVCTLMMRGKIKK